MSRKSKRAKKNEIVSELKKLFHGMSDLNYERKKNGEENPVQGEQEDSSEQAGDVQGVPKEDQEE